MRTNGPSYPLLDINWRTPGPLCPLAVGYVNAADVDFSLLEVHHVDTPGNRIARECGYIRWAARRAQAIEMRKLESQVEAERSMVENHPQLRDQISQIHTIGALPFFRGQPPVGPRPRGLPYDASRTVDVAKKIRNDVRQGRVFVITPHVDGKDAPLIATPTTTVRKKLPDRTMSGDFRIISDLR